MTTIFAPATAAARAAVGIIRISGPGARQAAECLGVRLGAPRRAVVARFRDPSRGEVLDRGLVLWFPGPASYTGEDMVEIHHHGGLAVQRALLEALAGIEGLRPADPGEFTRRAFLNGKMDLTEAEAVADLVDATSRAQARQALRQLDGALGRRFEEWRRELMALRARVEAEIDFSAEEGDVGEGAGAAILPQVGRLREAFERELEAGRRGERLRSGVHVAVLGPPNVGKSSLVNLLARRDVAIVSPLPGTTRDVIEVPLELEGLPVVLFDTAGLRESADPVEREGIRRAEKQAECADLRLFLTEPGSEHVLPEPAEDLLVVVNKADLGRPDRLERPHHVISCRTGEGIEELLGWLATRSGELLGEGEAATITRLRHRKALEEARDALARVLEGGEEEELAVVAEELRHAAWAVGRVTGRVGVEDLLDEIFARFCIGK